MTEASRSMTGDQECYMALIEEEIGDLAFRAANLRALLAHLKAGGTHDDWVPPAAIDRGTSPWIAVEAGLPEITTWEGPATMVLATDPAGGVFTAFLVPDSPGRTGWRDHEGEDRDGVSHWMPLPAPPEPTP